MCFLGLREPDIHGRMIGRKIKPVPANPGRFSLRLKVIYFQPLNKEPQNLEVNDIVLCLQKLLLFEIPCLIFDIQKCKTG